MTAEDIPSLILILVLLIFSALFSSSETSLFALDDVNLKKLRKNKKARRIRQLLKQSSVVLVAILLGNTAVNVATSALMEHTLHIESYVLSTLVVTAIILFFGEITPKTMAIARVEGVALFTSRIFFPIYVVLKPLAKPIEGLSSLLLKAVNRLHRKSNGTTDISESHLAALLSMVSRGKFLEGDEKKLVERVLKFTSREVWNIMTPRTKVTAIKKRTPLSEAITLIKESRFSKIPVYSKTNDNIVGVIYLRDLFYYLHHPDEIGKKTVGDIMENMYFVPETKKLSEMLQDFQEKKMRMAAVVDEYGSSIGIVTISDVLGEIVGEIVDESFELDKKIVRVTRNRFVVAGDIGIDDFNEHFNTKLSSEDFESLAGFVIEQAGDIPEVGYSIDIERLTITVRERSTNYINKFLIERK